MLDDPALNTTTQGTTAATGVAMSNDGSSRAIVAVQ
jgi:hypothetical protein